MSFLIAPKHNASHYRHCSVPRNTSESPVLDGAPLGNPRQLHSCHCDVGFVQDATIDPMYRSICCAYQLGLGSAAQSVSQTDCSLSKSRDLGMCLDESAGKAMHFRAGSILQYWQEWISTAGHCVQPRANSGRGQSSDTKYFTVHSLSAGGAMQCVPPAKKVSRFSVRSCRVCNALLLLSHDHTALQASKGA